MWGGYTGDGWSVSADCVLVGNCNMGGADTPGVGQLDRGGFRVEGNSGQSNFARRCVCTHGISPLLTDHPGHFVPEPHYSIGEALLFYNTPRYCQPPKTVYNYGVR